jgi:hypothetical protein
MPTIAANQQQPGDEKKMCHLPSYDKTTNTVYY